MATTETISRPPLYFIKKVQSGNHMNPTENQVFDMLKKRLQNATILHEGVELIIRREKRQWSTRPDFCITKGETTIYLEITESYNTRLDERGKPKKSSHKGRLRDPKVRQKGIAKKVLENSAPHIKYLVLYGQHLENIARAHPDELTLPRLLKNNNPPANET